jgi:hypothetical protein
MIILRRRNKPNILSDYIKSIQNDIDKTLDDRILKLDKRHLSTTYKSHNNIVSNLHSAFINEIRQASVVIYKEDWNTDAPINLIKFRYHNNKLPKYMNIINDMPVCKQIYRYDSEGNKITIVRFSENDFGETFI